MTEPQRVVAIVEGATEQIFVQSILAPYLWSSGVQLQATILGKPGRKGGNVQFQRASRDIRTHLRQRHDTWVTVMVDYYAIGKDWPGLGESKQVADPARKAEILNAATLESVRRAERTTHIGSFRTFPCSSSSRCISANPKCSPALWV